MATITLTGNTLAGNLGVGSFMAIGNSFKNAKSSAGNLSLELGILKTKLDTVCTTVNVDSSKECTQRIKDREENKKSALTCGYNKLDVFISDVGCIDNRVATRVEKEKQDFYCKYNYLKPNKEKNLWDKTKDGLSALWDGYCSICNAIDRFVKDVVEWCKEHWVELLVGLAVIIVGALITVLTAGAGTAFWAAFGMAVLKGVGAALLSGLIGGSISGGVTYVSARFSGCDRKTAFSMAKKEFGNGFAQGFLSGSFGFLGGAVGTWIGGTYNTFRGIQYLSKGSGLLSTGMDLFENGTNLLGSIFPNSGLKELNEKVTSTNAYKNTKIVVDCISSFSNGAYKKAEIKDGSHINTDGTLKDNVKYQSGENGYHYTTDGKGRITSGYAEKLKMKQHEGVLRHDSKTPGKLANDDAGHIFADRFGGSNKLDNLTSQSRELNRAGKPYFKMENEWAKALKEGNSVSNVKIKIKYEGNSFRPSSYKASYKIDGVRMPKLTFKN